MYMYILYMQIQETILAINFLLTKKEYASNNQIQCHPIRLYLHYHSTENYFLLTLAIVWTLLTNRAMHYPSL